MATLDCYIIPSTSSVYVVDSTNDDDPLDGAVDIGSFDHPDPVYPDSVVIFHGVRDLLYKVDAEGVPALFPDNVTNMQDIKIFVVTPLAISMNLPATIDATIGDEVVFSVVATGGYGPYTYNWYKDDVLLPADHESSFTIDLAQVDDSGDWNVVVIDVSNNAVSSVVCTLTVA